MSEDTERERLTETLPNGNVIKYLVYNGTAYHEETDPALVTWLETMRAVTQCGKPSRVRVFLGDPKTGRDWGECYGVTGYIGRSMGPIKIPLLVYNSRSYGGGALLDHCIVKLVSIKTKRVLWVHPGYHLPALTFGAAVYPDLPIAVYQAQETGEPANVANFPTLAKAERWIKFITGKRMAP